MQTSQRRSSWGKSKERNLAPDCIYMHDKQAEELNLNGKHTLWKKIATETKKQSTKQ